VPTVVEQDKIVELLTSLDDTVALHQRNLEQLKKIKQALLQKMFV
jgi:type I restriction enzyme S subunit